MSTLHEARFVGKAIIVTGAGSGIGRQTAIQLAAEGGLVVIADIDADGAEATSDAIRQAGGQVCVWVTDVSNAAAVAAMVECAVANFGRLGVPHNNAYWAPLNTTLTETTDEQWERTLGVTLAGSSSAAAMRCRTGWLRFRCHRQHCFHGRAHCWPGLCGLHRGEGRRPGFDALGGIDYGKYGIWCNAVSPGLIRTAATEPVLANPDHVGPMMDRTRVGSPGEPADIANAVLFLASDESAFMTGQPLIVDGGRVAS